MISIIIASANKEQLADVIQNIARTIGLKYEIIPFNNSEQQHGLCEIYNTGAKKAKYDIICFMHEDIELKTQGWGNIVKTIFDADGEIGVIGIAGSAYKSLAPSGWFCSGGIQPVNNINLLQRYKFNKKETSLTYENPANNKIAEVITIDGVWFCTKKEIVLKEGFDEDTFRKFHCYDLDFALTISQKYKNVVTFDILLEHFSEGNYDRNWIEETLKLQKKWQNKLPLSVSKYSKKEITIFEKHTFRFLLKQMGVLKYTRTEKLNVLLKTKLISKVGPTLFFKLFIEIFTK